MGEIVEERLNVSVHDKPPGGFKEAQDLPNRLMRVATASETKRALRACEFIVCPLSMAAGQVKHIPVNADAAGQSTRIDSRQTPVEQGQPHEKPDSI
jgi:hypothetical protein